MIDQNIWFPGAAALPVSDQCEHKVSLELQH